jgi:cytochrome c biogenesis protein
MGGRKKEGVKGRRTGWTVPTPWHLLNSMSFAIGLLAVLMIVSAVGVIVPQGAPDSVYLSKYGGLFGRVLLAAGFDDTFRVWWYVALWAIVVASLLVCSFNRLPVIIRLAFGKPLLSAPADFKTYTFNANLKCKIPPDKALAEVESALKRRHLRIYRGGETARGFRSLLAHRGDLERLGPFITHMSLVLVLIGGMLAAVAGSRHNQPAYSGEFFEVPDLSHRKSLAYHADKLLKRLPEESLLRDEMGMMDWRRLPDIPEKQSVFGVRVESFVIERTPEGGVADYKTTATVFDPDSVKTFVIEVNKPMIHKGYYFYQSSYGYASRTVEVVHILVTDKEGNPVAGHVELPFNVPVEIPGTPLTVVATGFVADFVYDIETKSAQSRSDEHRNPAVQIEVYREGEKQFDQWLMMRGMGAHASKDEAYDFRIMSYDPDMYTVLEVRTHPVMNVIWTGFALMAIGVCLSFYLTQRRIWAGVRETGERSCEVLLAGTSRKDRESFKRNFDLLVKEIRGKTK